MDTFDTKLLKRAIGQKKKYTSVKSLYGDRSWARDLDIVNELGGHTGCVNALSWSTNGNLLASGSDDTYLNIWEYNPTNQTKPFTLNTSVATGHHANIFSVKFMPHSGDCTVVTCAGDSEIRVFDLEYGGGAQGGSASESTRSRRFNTFFPNARWLTEANTNARVYRSHADRAKRIVTESSPYLFLSCSEDGEVRQWDLRQPSSAYPPPRDGRRFAFRRMAPTETSGEAPPPLISYKRYGLDLNTISCSGTQPQYIALGGAHLHCFLHDRRMLGRDLGAEHGTPAASSPAAGSAVDEAMREATRCVRRFAPNNKRKMRARDSGHITACKISDARPNELISSWSGDHIYSFDIVKSPDARDAELRQDETFQQARLKNAADRKRKRAKATTSTSSQGEGASSGRRLRPVPDDRQEEGHTALRVQYENGETEDISLDRDDMDPESAARTARDNLLSEAQKQSERVARALCQLRRTLFDFSSTLGEEQVAAMETSTELTGHTSSFTKALGQACSLLPEMSEIMRTWAYPMDPDQEEVTFQNTLRRNRQAAWRFVQAAGTLSRVLGGRLQTPSSASDPRTDQFHFIRPAVHEAKSIDDKARFCYDFLKAISLWLEGGKEAVLVGFRKSPDLTHGESHRFPLDGNDTESTLPSKLRDYLLAIASEEKPIIDLGTNRFERDELRLVFQDQKAAVQAFARALENIELRSHHGTSELVHLTSGGTTKRVMDKGAAARFWGVKVGRALLMEASNGVNFGFVNRAFGGLRVHVVPGFEEQERPVGDIDPDEEDPVVDSVDLITAATESEATETNRENSTEDTEMTEPLRVLVEDADEEDGQDIILEEEDEDEDENTNNSSDDDPNEENDSDEDEEHTRLLYRRRIGFGRSYGRAQVNDDVSYSSHTKVYRGHCNTRTVKDVNYYGLDDDYIVSGSDDGHFFIWDRKTSEIVNILEGDGEVVNVVQGHPYEPMIACSGIDSTVKIFGPGGESRERYDASRGINIANPGGGRHSSLGFGARVRRARRAAANIEDDSDSESDDDEAPQTTTTTEQHPETAEETASRKGLNSRRAINREYEITAQNDTQRRQGAGDTFVTQGMLVRFAAALQRGEIQGVVGQGFGGEGGTVVLDDNYHVIMHNLVVQVSYEMEFHEPEAVDLYEGIGVMRGFLDGVSSDV